MYVNSIFRIGGSMIRIPTFSINFYAIFILLSVVIGLGIIALLLKKDNKLDTDCILLFMIMFIFIIVFGKYYTLFISMNFSQEFMELSLSSYGGLLGGIFAAFLYEKVTKNNIGALKYTILVMPLIYGISKLACFSVGCCHGIPYNGFLSVLYVDKYDYAVFPVQLLETILNILLFFILYRNRSNKHIIEYTLISAATIKLLTDFLRFEHASRFFISSNQIVSLIIILIGIGLLIYKRSVKNDKMR